MGIRLFKLLCLSKQYPACINNYIKLRIYIYIDISKLRLDIIIYYTGFVKLYRFYV